MFVRFALCLWALCVSASSIHAQSTYQWDGIIQRISDDHTQIAARSGSGESFNMAVTSQALKDSLKDWATGDMAIFKVSGPRDTMTLQDIKPQTYPFDGPRRAGVLAAAAAIFLILAYLVTWKHMRELLFVGLDNRYSNSKCQVVVWFGALIVSYVATYFLRLWASHGALVGNISIPAHLAEISGLSAFTFAAAKGVTQAKDSAAAKMAAAASAAAASAPAANMATAVQAAAMNNGASASLAVAAGTAAALAPAGTAPQAAAASLSKSKATQPTFPGDLLKDDLGNWDLGDFQMIVIVALAFAVYLIQIFQFLGSIELRASITLPDVDSTLLASFGLGQGAYLAKKMAGSIKQ